MRATIHREHERAAQAPADAGVIDGPAVDGVEAVTVWIDLRDEADPAATHQARQVRQRRGARRVRVREGVDGVAGAVGIVQHEGHLLEVRGADEGSGAVHGHVEAVRVAGHVLCRPGDVGGAAGGLRP